MYSNRVLRLGLILSTLAKPLLAEMYPQHAAFAEEEKDLIVAPYFEMPFNVIIQYRITQFSHEFRQPPLYPSLWERKHDQDTDPCQSTDEKYCDYDEECEEKTP